MKTDTYAVFSWAADRQAIVAGIEKQIDALLEGKSTGTFILDVHGPYGSPNPDTKELKA